MVEQQQDNQLQFILSELGTRMRDVEERTNSIKERTLLINSNLIDSKEELEQRVSSIEKQNSLISQELKKINSTIQNLTSEINNFVRKDQIILVERMLKDFQPLEFIRKKDLEEYNIKIENEEKVNTKEIKTKRILDKDDSSQ